LLGSWTDAVYLSTDDQWDIDDKLLATVDHTGGLLTGVAYSGSAAAVVPGVLPGDYYIIVRADLYNQEKEGGDEGNNIVAIGSIPLDVRALVADGSATTGLLTRTDRFDYYALHAEANSNVSIELSGLSSSSKAELFISYETPPTRLSYDIKATYTSRGDLEAMVSGSIEGNYYILVYGAELDLSTPYSLTADQQPVALFSVTPTYHGTGVPCTMTLNGGGFDETTSVRFVAPDMTEWLPAECEVLSSTIMTAVLDLSSWPVGQPMDVIPVEGGVDFPGLEDGFTVTEGEPNLDVRLLLPKRMGFHWTHTLWIEYANTGNESILSPLLKLHSENNAILSLDPSLAGQQLSTFI